MKYQYLREKYPKFIYRKYSYLFSNNNLKIYFDFYIEPDLFFKPEIIIENVKTKFSKINKDQIENLIFNLGLAEIPSYWKVTASPLIDIKAGFLTKEQINFWRNLFMKGMGQFFYENKINFKKKNFLTIRSSFDKNTKSTELKPINLKEKYLVPVGGGRDSIITLEKLKQDKKKIGCFLVNPSISAINVVKTFRPKEMVIVKRKLDKKIFDLNKKGFLNGHTPFTSLLSFLSVFCAAIFNYKNIAFSNEKSSNEGNVKYLGEVINHQWSKSLNFEKKFRKYCNKYLIKNINYYSFLRKYKDIEISKIFVNYPKYFSVFSSCNKVLSQNNPNKRWCGNCPKCLFVYASLYPFINEKELLVIFNNNNIFENKRLLPTMKEMIGKGKHKPFECIGTYNENKKIFNLCLKKAIKDKEKENKKIPYLLAYFKNFIKK